MRRIFGILFLVVCLLSFIKAMPSVNLISPQNNSNISTIVNFNCSVSEPLSPLTANLSNITLYGNWSGGWHANETIDISNNASISVIFQKNIDEGKYVWNCLSENSIGEISFANTNRTFSIDKTPPNISSLSLNESFMCGVSSSVRVNCSVQDESGIDTVIIQATSESGSENFSASFLSGNTYSANIPVNSLGSWDFKCIANDTAGNINNSNISLEAYHILPDLRIRTQDMSFSDSHPHEGQTVNIFANIYNKGCQDANNSWTGFYINDPDIDGIQIGNNITLSIPARSNQTINVTWTTEMGPWNFFVNADFNDTILEGNESNNKANLSIEVPSWHDFYGDISSLKLLGDFSLNNMTLWFNESISTGNIFITDKESIITWTSLFGVGRDDSDNPTSNDFEEIDNIFSMSSFNDSISNKFTTNGNTPKTTVNFTIELDTIQHVPIINSTNNTNFITGIMWDSSDDSGDGEFSESDNEDLVFLTRINKNSVGAYGIYDYEVTVPVKLREQDLTDSSELYFFYELQ